MADYLEPLNLSLQSIPIPTTEALRVLSPETWFSLEGWYLAGGTALAMQYKHRASYDLDFFTQNTDFDTDMIIRRFTQDWTTTARERGTLYGVWKEVKISFIAYPHFKPMEKKMSFGQIPVLQSKDIAVMKIIAVSQRGKRRDFFDLYQHLNQTENLETLLLRVPLQYPGAEHNYHHILKSLMYFEDADTDPDVVTDLDVTWSAIKSFFIAQVATVTNTFLS